MLCCCMLGLVLFMMLIAWTYMLLFINPSIFSRNHVHVHICWPLFPLVIPWCMMIVWYLIEFCLWITWMCPAIKQWTCPAAVMLEPCHAYKIHVDCALLFVLGCHLSDNARLLHCVWSAIEFWHTIAVVEPCLLYEHFQCHAVVCFVWLLMNTWYHCYHDHCCFESHEYACLLLVNTAWCWCCMTILVSWCCSFVCRFNDEWWGMNAVTTWDPNAAWISRKSMWMMITWCWLFAAVVANAMWYAVDCLMSKHCQMLCWLCVCCLMLFGCWLNLFEVYHEPCCVRNPKGLCENSKFEPLASTLFHWLRTNENISFCLAKTHSFD